MTESLLSYPPKQECHVPGSFPSSAVVKDSALADRGLLHKDLNHNALGHVPDLRLHHFQPGVKFMSTGRTKDTV